MPKIKDRKKSSLLRHMIALCFVGKGSCFHRCEDSTCVYFTSQGWMQRYPAAGNVTEGHNTPKLYAERMKDDRMDDE